MQVWFNRTGNQPGLIKTCKNGLKRIPPDNEQVELSGHKNHS